MPNLSFLPPGSREQIGHYIVVIIDAVYAIAVLMFPLNLKSSGWQLD